MSLNCRRAGLTNPRRNALQQIVLATCVLVLACGDSTTAPIENEPESKPEYPLVGSVAVAPGVQLHYIDFGGTGEPLVLLAGLGHTANVFREFAPLLTDDFRVLALTRRGFGQSSRPSTGYDPATLATDIRVFLDSLGIASAHLVGHSIAGEEMNRFAIDHADQLGRLVYLDAAYDRTSLWPWPDTTDTWSVPPLPTSSHTTSIAAFGEYIVEIYGVSFPTEEIAAGVVTAADGSVLGYSTPPWVSDSIRNAVASPAYDSIMAPVLAIYAVPLSASDLFSWLTPSSPDWADAEDWVTSVFAPFLMGMIDDFETALPSASIIEVEGGKHHVFISDEATVVSAIISFIEGS